jgi:signal transduction histidine kinase
MIDSERLSVPGAEPQVGTRFDDWLDRVKRTATGFSVRTKILGIVLALTTVLGLAVTWQVRVVMTSVMVTELESRGRSIVSDIAARTVDPILLDDTYSVFEILQDTIANHPDAIYGFILDSDGTVLAHTFGAEGFPTELLAVNTDESAQSIRHTLFDSGEGRVHDFTAPILSGRSGTVRLGLSEARLIGVVGGMTTQMLATTLFVGLVGAAAASLLTWLLTRPILDLVSTTRRVGDGDLSARASHWAHDEIGALSVAFNQMVDDLESNRTTIAENEAARTRLLEQLIAAQEEERKRISRELHDIVGQALSSLMVGIAVLARAAGEDSKARSDDMQTLAAETLEQVRQLGRELRPSALDDLGLAAALDRYAEDFEVMYPEVTVDLHVHLPSRLSSSTETSLYRIVQEGMTNAARHGRGRTLSVLVSKRGASVRAIIEDDGVGFDPVAARKNGQSVGIHGMQERAELLGGHVNIESGEGGTTLYVEVPV